MKSFKMKFLHFLMICFLSLTGIQLHAQEPVFSWANGIGNNGSSRANAVATDAEGNVYITGLFIGTTDFDPGTATDTLAPTAATDAFIAKYDANGNYVWAHNIDGNQAGTWSSNEGLGIAVDTAGNVYATGYYIGNADFDPGPKTAAPVPYGANDIYIVKYDKDGKFMWVKTMGGGGDDWGQAIALDAEGNVLITGHFWQAADFDTFGSAQGHLVAKGDHDIFVAKYDPNGNYVWAKNVGSAASQSQYGDGAEGHGIVADTAGSVYVTGYFQGIVTIGTDTLTAPLDNNNARQADIFIAKWDKDGNPLWGENMGGTGIDIAGGIAIDKASNVYITGWFSGTAADFDPSAAGTAFLTSNNYDIFVAKYDQSGKYEWAKNLGGNSYDYGHAITVNGAGNVIVTGYFSGDVDFNPGGTPSVLNAADNDIFLAQYNTNGNYIWAGSIGSTGTYHSDDGKGITAGANGALYVTGQYYGSPSDFDPGPNTEARDNNKGIFVLKLECGDTSSSYLDTTVSCQGYELNGTVYTETGLYTVVMPNVIGCDSTVTLDLTVQLPEAFISIDEFVLHTTQPFATYQWMLNDQIIPGATDSTYTVNENGNYQVIVTNESGCTDTSDVYKVTNVPAGLKDLQHIGQQIKIYPNPASDIIHIEAPCPVDITLNSIEGKVVKQAQHVSSVSIGSLSEGIYFLYITDGNGNLLKVQKVVRNK